MHPNPSFRKTATADALAFATERGFGVLAVNGPEGPICAHVPFTLHDDGALLRMCVDEGLRLATDRLAYVSHWITPVEQPKRFNTRFFVARAPSRQEALHDGFETVESHWVRPETALDRWQRGELNLISPTFTDLSTAIQRTVQGG